jgi:spermidine synthase
MNDRFPGIFLLAAVFVIAVCGLVYELIAASLSSYLLGGSITQFSIVIGVFLTAMGLGSYLTRYINKRLVEAFVVIEIGIGLCGGLSAVVLLLTFSVMGAYRPTLVAVLTLTGTLVGMEIPILIRILRSREALRLTVSNVLALDYLGALFASCAFPLLLVPHLGLLRTSFLFGLINVAVAAVSLRVLSSMLRRKRMLGVMTAVAAVILGTGLAGSGVFSSMAEDLIYQDDIIFTRQTPYQRIVVTKWHDDFRLYLDGHLQFSSVDEHRYHESMVHPAVAATPHTRTALILGGGDGMAARELLKYRQIQTVDLVDLDEEMIRLFRDHPLLSQLCSGSLSDQRVTVHIEDAGKFMEATTQSWDLIFIDLPDPTNLALSRLYTTSTYRLIAKRLGVQGVIVTQATSPFYAPEAFWCIARTWAEAPVGPEGKDRLNVYPYHVYVPSFGDWGFVMATGREIEPRNLRLAEVPLKFLTSDVLPTLFTFPKDSLSKSEVQANRMDDQVLVQYYRMAWRRYNP